MEFLMEAPIETEIHFIALLCKSISHASEHPPPGSFGAHGVTFPRPLTLNIAFRYSLICPFPWYSGKL